jgi:hypothetical protein
MLQAGLSISMSRNKAWTGRTLMRMGRLLARWLVAVLPRPSGGVQRAHPQRRQVQRQIQRPQRPPQRRQPPPRRVAPAFAAALPCPCSARPGAAVGAAAIMTPPARLWEQEAAEGLLKKSRCYTTPWAPWR